MNYLSDKHRELAQSQQSGLMAWFGQLPFDRKAAAIGLSLTLGLSCAGMAWRGTASDRIYFCIRTPANGLKCVDNNNRPFRMTPYYWQQWKQRGMPTEVVTDAATGVNGLVKATNPYKPYWAFGAFAGFALAGWMLRHCQHEVKQLAIFEDIAQKRDVLEASRDVLIAEVELQADLELAANNRVVEIQQAEILGETELAIAKLEADDALFEAQTAGMTPEQKAEYIKFLRDTKTPYLQGTQTLQGTVDPSDKVTAAPEHLEIAPTTDLSITEVLRRVAREDGSTALCGDPGTGKSTITREYIRQVEANCPNADIRVLAVKNDSFNGLRERGKVTRFVGENAIDNARTFFLGVQTEYNKRLELTESGRESLPPIVIILDDWLTIAAKLNKVKPEDLGFDFGQILFDVLIVGREYNMKFFVNLHSLNLKAIGIQELDQNTRKVLRLLLLGNRYRKDGREIDAYGVIEQAIMGNQVITHAKDKELVRAQYSELKAQSRSQYQPVMFAFVGGYYLGLVPKFQQVEVSVRPVTAEDKSKLEALYRQMEFEITYEKHHKEHSHKLSPQAQALHGYLHRTGRSKAVVAEIQPNFKVKGDRFSAEELKRLFNELVENSLAVWTDANTIEISQNQTDGQTRQS
jgi:hypothetical protein